MKTTWRAESGRMLVWVALLCLPPVAAAADAVNVTIEADATELTVGQTTTVRVYGRIDAGIAAASEQIASWYVDVLNSNGSAAGGFTNVSTPTSDNTPPTSFDGTPDGAHLRGIHDWFFDTPGAGKSDRIELLRFDVTALAAGTSTFTVAPGTTLGVVHDFQVAQLGFGGTFTGGNYSAASVEITVSGELNLAGLGLQVRKVGTDARVTFTPVPGYDHVVQASTTLQPASWTPLPGGPHNTGSVNQALAGFPVRFFRVVLTPR